MIKYSFTYAIFTAFLNSWNKSFIKRALFVDFGLEEKYQTGFLGRVANSFINASLKVRSSFSRLIDNSLLCSFYNETVEKITSNKKLIDIWNASFFARLISKAFSFGLTELSIFALAFLFPIVPTKVVLALCAVITMLFLINVFVTGKTKLRLQLMDLFVLMFLILLTYSIFISYNMKSSAPVVLAYALFICVFFAIKNTINTREKLYVVISLIVLSGILVAAYGIYQKITGDYVATDAWIDSEMFETATFRIYSTLGNPNVLGEYLLFIIPLAFATLYYLKNNLYKLVALGILGISALCMVYTQSRGAWLGLIFALALFALLKDKRLVILGFIGLMFLPFVLPSSIIERFTSIGNMSDSSTNYRVNIWIASLLMIKKFWPSGIGLGTDTFVYIYRMFAFNSVYAPHSHNLFLQIMIDLGIFGMIIFIAFMCCFFKNLLVTIHKTDDKFLKAASAAIFAGMAGFLLQGLTDNVWYNYRIVAMFWLLLALSGVLLNLAALPQTTHGNSMENIYSEISNLAKKYKSIDKIILFGSRARNDNDDRSDIDLAVFSTGIDAETQSDFRIEIEEKTSTLLKYDIVFIDGQTDENLIGEIKKDGAPIYEKS